jgi:hypothetical protein
MKKIKTLFGIVLAAAFFFNACDDSLFDASESFTFETEFIVLSDDADFFERKVINLSEDCKIIASHGSKIKNIQVETIRYWLKSHNGTDDQKVSNLTVKVGNGDGSDQKVLLELDEVLLHQMLNNPAFLSLNAEGVSKFEDLAEIPPHTFTYDISLTGNEAPYDFTIVLEVKAKLTANALQ